MRFLIFNYLYNWKPPNKIIFFNFKKKCYKNINVLETYFQHAPLNMDKNWTFWEGKPVIFCIWILMLNQFFTLLSWKKCSKRVGTFVIIMRNCVHQNHTTQQLKLKKNSYIIIVQLSFRYYNYCATIPLEIWGINK
jgi:hypothetical protein